MNEQIELVKCKGCLSDFTENDICEDGYCMCCQYQHEANQNELTDGE